MPFDIDKFALLHKITNPYKLHILSMINTQSCTVSDLKEKLLISKPEISRHLSYLRKNYFIERIPDSHYYIITSIGLSIIQLLNPLQFILTQKEYFQNHLPFLPIHLLSQIDCLSNSTLVSTIGKVMMTIERILTQEIKELYIVSDEQYPFDLKCKHARFIFSDTFLSHLEMPKAEIDEFFAEEQILELKSIEKVSIILIILDNHTGMIFFPTSDEKIDMTVGFLVEDEKGINFLKQIWDYFWKKGKIVTKDSILNS